MASLSYSVVENYINDHYDEKNNVFLIYTYKQQDAPSGGTAVAGFDPFTFSVNFLGIFEVRITPSRLSSEPESML